jgi:hypothetical protein
MSSAVRISIAGPIAISGASSCAAPGTVGTAGAADGLPQPVTTIPIAASISAERVAARWVLRRAGVIMAWKLSGSRIQAYYALCRRTTRGCPYGIRVFPVPLLPPQPYRHMERRTSVTRHHARQTLLGNIQRQSGQQAQIELPQQLAILVLQHGRRTGCHSHATSRGGRGRLLRARQENHCHGW